MKYIITEDQYDKMIDRFISSRFEGFEEKKSPLYPDSIFWVKDGEIIAEIENSEYFNIKKSIWSVILGMFSFKYNDAQYYINNWLDKHHNLGELMPAFKKFGVVERTL